MEINRTATLFALSLLGALASTSKLMAADEVWTHVVSSCTIDEGLDFARAGVDAGRLMFADGRTGTIKARCNVTNPKDNGNNPAWTRLDVVYRDNDGNLKDASGNDRINVKVILYRVYNSTGGQTALVTFNSSDYPTVQDTMKSKSINVNFDFTNYAYYFLVEIKRSVAGDAPKNVSASIIRLIDVD